MGTQSVLAKKKRGPAPTGKGVQVVVRLQPAPLTALDQWVATQSDRPTRAEAIRRLVELGLKANTLEPKAVGRLRERVAGGAELAARAVDSLTVGAADADERASRKRRRTKAKGK
jgi:Arc/MetJ-type ribon-helix-helix transcriptional regulator